MLVVSDPVISAQPFHAAALGALAEAGLAVCGTLMGVPATGRPIDIAVLDLFRFEGDRLVEHWPLLDNLGLLRLIGVTTI